MYQLIQNRTSRWLERVAFTFLILICFSASIFAQEAERRQPSWWFGGSVAGNLNFYGGTTQMLNSELTTPSPFHKGFGVGLYIAPLLEYRPDPVWGGILQLAYDDRRGSFSDVPCPCGQVSTLSTTIRYFSIEPSIRYAPFSDAFYVFAGPRLGFNWAFNFPNASPRDERTFVYTQEGSTATKAEFSNNPMTDINSIT